MKSHVGTFVSMKVIKDFKDSVFPQLDLFKRQMNDILTEYQIVKEYLLGLDKKMC